MTKKCKRSRYSNKDSLDYRNNDILGFHNSLRVALFDFKYEINKFKIKTQYHGVQSRKAISQFLIISGTIFNHFCARTSNKWLPMVTERFTFPKHGPQTSIFRTT